MPIPTIARPMQKDDSLVRCPKNASDRRRLRSWVTKIPRPQVSWSTGCGFLLFVRSKGTGRNRYPLRYQDIQKGVVLGFFLYEQTFTIVRLLMIGDIPCDVINLQTYASVEHVVTLRDLAVVSWFVFHFSSDGKSKFPKAQMPNSWLLVLWAMSKMSKTSQTYFWSKLYTYADFAWFCDISLPQAWLIWPNSYLLISSSSSSCLS